MAKIDMLSMTIEQWKAFLQTIGEPAFRAKQIFHWLHKKQITDIDHMTNLSKTWQNCRCKGSQKTGFKNRRHKKISLFAGKRFCN